MPTIFEYLGLILKFYSKEHLPIHVHAFYGDRCAMKVEFFLKGEKITRKTYKGVKGYRHLPPAQMRDLRALINKYEYQIVDAWITFVVKNERITNHKITRKIK